jgi:hypothetical protein
VNRPRRPALLWVLVALLSAEFLLMAALAAIAVIGVAEGGAGSLAGGVALAIIVILAALALGAMVIGAIRGQAWIRAAGIVWQILQIAVGIGALQGALAQPVWGWPLVVVGVVAFILLFTPPVVAATRRRDDDAL